LEAARSEISREGALDPKRLSVGSNYFEISGRLRMDGRVLEERMLVKRQNREITSLRRSRQALQPGLE
jgi:general secretion pathway protein K